MAEDQTGQSNIRRLQDGDVLEVGSSGTLDNYGTITNTTGGTFANAGTQTNAGTLTNTGTILHSGNGASRLQSETAVGLSTESTGGVMLSAYGMSQITTTGTSAGTARAVFNIPAPPAIGLEKVIYATFASTTVTAVVSTTAVGILIGTSNSTSHGNFHAMIMNDPEDCVVMRGITATAWGIVSNTGSVVLSTVLDI